MAVSVSVDVDSFQVEQMLRAVRLSISPSALVAFLDGPVQDHFAADIEMRFAYEGDAKSGDWPWLTDATNSIRRSQGFAEDSPINVRTGKLLDFVTTEFDSGPVAGGAQISIPGNAPAGELENKLKHAQFGATDNPMPGARPTPPRPVLAFDETDMEVILGLLSIHILEFAGTAL